MEFYLGIKKKTVVSFLKKLNAIRYYHIKQQNKYGSEI